MSTQLSAMDLRKFRIKLGETTKKGYSFYCGDRNDTAEQDEKIVKKMPSVKKIKLPKKYIDLGCNIGIYGDKIAMVHFGGGMHSVIIESMPFRKALLTLFELAEIGCK